MENLNPKTKQELKKYKYDLYTLDGAFVERFHTRIAAEKMQAIRWNRDKIALQIKSTKI